MTDTSTPATGETGSLEVFVFDTERTKKVVNAAVTATRTDIPVQSRTKGTIAAATPGVPITKRTDASGKANFPSLPHGSYEVVCQHFPGTPLPIDIAADQPAFSEYDINIGAWTEMNYLKADCTQSACPRGRVTDTAIATVGFNATAANVFDRATIDPARPWQPWTPPAGAGKNWMFSNPIRRAGGDEFRATLNFSLPGNAEPELIEEEKAIGPARMDIARSYEADDLVPTPVSVSLNRSAAPETRDVALWKLIQRSTEAVSFNNYHAQMNKWFCPPGVLPGQLNPLLVARALPFIDSDAYRVLKAATEAFVMVNCGVLTAPPIDGLDDYLVKLDSISTLPYLANIVQRKLPDIQITAAKPDQIDLCYGIAQSKLAHPCMLELIWSYWNEEGMLVQTMNAITQRFQNVRAGASHDPLANLEIDPLRPLNNLIWGYTQDEQHRLSVVRRNYEYDHHYGIRLAGKAVRNFRPADSRSKFLESFHFLLRQCIRFYRQDDDTTVKADAFPVLNAIKEVHLILSQGAHNQFGDLPSTARVEMLMQQWLLARPEFREFLPTRIMVAYPEPWMDRVDAMKKVQGWTDTSVIHFRALAVFGEKLLLTIRYGHWSDVDEADQALNWARFWRSQVQGYIHAYRSATGLDLSTDVSDSAVNDGTLPAILLQQRLSAQARLA